MTNLTNQVSDQIDEEIEAFTLHTARFGLMVDFAKKMESIKLHMAMFPVEDIQRWEIR
jgi:hypothetical protein